MLRPATPVWTSLTNFEEWITRNCRTCKWRTKPAPFNESGETCLVPNRQLTATVKATPPSEHDVRIIFGLPIFRMKELPKLPPHKCQSRLDTRGRPNRR